MKNLLALFFTGCVARETIHPVYRYDYTEARSYDCPHATDTPDTRCDDGGSPPEMTR